MLLGICQDWRRSIWKCSDLGKGAPKPLAIRVSYFFMGLDCMRGCMVCDISLFGHIQRSCALFSAGARNTRPSARNEQKALKRADKRGPAVGSNLESHSSSVYAGDETFHHAAPACSYSCQRCELFKRGPPT